MEVAVTDELQRYVHDENGEGRASLGDEHERRAIRRLLENSSLSLEEVSRLVAAYEQTLSALDLVDRHDPVTEIVAKKVVEIGKHGGDAIEISKLAVKELGFK
jgi:hypothetical protein